MARVKVFQLISILSTILLISVKGQVISSSCTGSMVSTFTPCLNFITGSTSNGALSPTESCCGSLRSLMSGSMDCVCLIVTANVPLQLPINRTLALSLPQACNMGGVPIQCKASGTPLPAPGPFPFLLPPTPAPTATSPLSPQASKASAEGPASESETPLDLAPASPPDEPEAPSATTNPGIRPVLEPSASNQFCISPPLMLLISLIGITIFNLY